jgi:hypothetical protein
MVWPDAYANQVKWFVSKRGASPESAYALFLAARFFCVIFFDVLPARFTAHRFLIASASF